MSEGALAPTPDLPFPWAEPSIEAAILVAEDRLTDDTIAKRVGVHRSTFYRWKQHPEFKARVKEHLNEFSEHARSKGLARIDRRMAAYEDRHKRMSRVIRERARDMNDEAPGGGTGLLTRQYKVMGSGESATTITEYSVDTGLLREIRELEKQIAQDSGQWSEKIEHTGEGGEPLKIVIERVTREASS